MRQSHAHNGTTPTHQGAHITRAYTLTVNQIQARRTISNARSTINDTHETPTRTQHKSHIDNTHNNNHTRQHQRRPNTPTSTRNRLATVPLVEPKRGLLQLHTVGHSEQLFLITRCAPRVLDNACKYSAHARCLQRQAAVHGQTAAHTFSA